MSERTRMKSCDRRAQLIEVSRRCFAELGYNCTTTAEIARLAGVSEPVLYRHFRSKLDLLHALLEDCIQQASAHFEEIASHGRNGAEKLLAIVEDFPTFSVESNCIFKMADRALAGATDEKSRELLRKHYGEYHKIFSALIQEGIDDGSIEPHTNRIIVSWLLIMAGVGQTLISGLEVPELLEPGVPSELADLLRMIIGRRD